MKMQLDLPDVDNSRVVAVIVDKSAFERFKAAYPKRDGANPWQPARIKFETLVKRGVDAEMIIRGVRQLAVEMHASKQLGTRFVPQAITWLNQQRYADSTSAATETPVDQETYWAAVIASYKRFGRWNRYAGPDPESPACRCPRELLIKHGIIQEPSE